MAMRFPFTEGVTLLCYERSAPARSLFKLAVTVAERRSHEINRSWARIRGNRARRRPLNIGPVSTSPGYRLRGCGSYLCHSYPLDRTKAYPFIPLSTTGCRYRRDATPRGARG